MLYFATDEDFNRHILRGLLSRLPELDILRAQDAGLRTTRDPSILRWAAEEDRGLLSHDIQTIPGFAYERVARGERMPGVFIVPQSMPIREVIENLIYLATCSIEGEWEGRVLYLPAI